MNTVSSSQHQLNLARKWRPKNFDQVVGQDIAVKMIKNSLFLNKFFPVYLFAGQRGCGKTSTARVLAAAVNCHELPQFQKNPASFTIPCLTCASCQSMIDGNHPDFIEIDAASHTGVDNVRQIIESSNYMPLVGCKKIYLIDEAHMLSKAAFNAFLKVLEEPPATVLFILATTETPKIPVTVLSRCFQLIFNPIDAVHLKNHLRQICTQEQVEIDDAALDLILAETEGSARDAINLLERIRFSGDIITEQSVLSVLGKISNNDLFTLFTYLLAQDAPGMLEHLVALSFEQRSPHALWDMIVHLCRALVWTKYGVKQLPAHFVQCRNELVSLAETCSINRLNSILNLLWTQEEIFLKTHKKHLFLEMVLLQICQQVNINDLEDLIKSCQSLDDDDTLQPPPVSKASLPPQTLSPVPSIEPISKQVPKQIEQPLAPAQQASTAPTTDPSWALFQSRITSLNDQLLASIINQAQFVRKDEASSSIIIQLSTESSFFKTKIDETKPLWSPLLVELFTGYTTITYSAGTLKPPPPAAPPRHAAQSALPQPPLNRPVLGAQQYHTPAPSTPPKEPEFLVIKDPEAWPRTSLILRYFSGKIRKVKARSTSPST